MSRSKTPEIETFLRVFRTEFHQAPYIISEELSRAGTPYIIIRIPSGNPNIRIPLTLHIMPNDFSWGWVDGHHDHTQRRDAVSDEERARILISKVKRLMDDKLVLGTHFRGNAKAQQWIRHLDGPHYPLPSLEPGERCVSLSWTGKFDAVWDSDADRPAFLSQFDSDH